MKHNPLRNPFYPRERGQSLVEVALFFPIFIIIVAGLVEVSNLVITQNRVNNAARVGARFGANGGENEGMMIAALNSVTQTLGLEEDVWDVWAIRGQVNSAGTAIDPDTWEFEHVYGVASTQAFSDVNETEVRQQVLDQLRTDQSGNNPGGIAGGLRFVGLYTIHDIQSILGLDVLPALAGLNSISSLNVMRTFANEASSSAGCNAFPIIVQEGLRSVLPPGVGTPGGQNSWPTRFDYPSPEPNYNSFVNHEPDRGFNEAREGYVFKILNGTGNGSYGWLAWNGCANSATDLREALRWPGNSTNYTPQSGNCSQYYPGDRVLGYVEPGDPTDRSLHIGDWVKTSTGSISSNGVDTQLNEHITLRRQLRLIVYEVHDNGSGNHLLYQIKRFVIMRLIGYKLNQGSGEPSYIMAEFIRWDDSCGQPVTLP
jgi:hypothetical protein